MAEQEIPHEFSSRGRKRTLTEGEESISEEEVDDGGVDSNDSEESDDAVIYYSDDSEVDDTNRHVWDQYYKELDESEGFDFSVHPGTSFHAPISQLRSYLKNPEKKKRYTDLCNMAIGLFNSLNAKKYEFVDIVRVNVSYAAGAWYYFTFKASDTDTDDADAVKTFQALVWNGIDETSKVEFCRLKKSLSSEGPFKGNQTNQRRATGNCTSKHCFNQVFTRS
ncbi:PREDICTED: uncharacterized protein LOC109235785 isoform X2 [Nicotiana attenuata]|uniref:Cystatin domain-containing protein n=1 Tax=Nicotiana attenuata TaxID=49451 RepID=A0A1J6I7J9_NICAT|nr:PREDICTED: uncharacterized protein LOC109235785 isoform X2 [Nicotiana attenuata]OIS96511.1 hypothetical protein A4A49_16778 [Nicotiana attenuata]